MSALLLDAATERVAVNLLCHLEWQSDGFSLVFLFADVGPSLQLATWLDQRLAAQGQPLQRREVRDSFVNAPEAEVDRLVASFGELSAQPGGVWCALQRHPGDARWNRARTLFLARLNERRFLLERDLKRPLVLVLPAHFRPETRSIAPDIWHKRDLSEELRAAGDARPVVGHSVATLAVTGSARAEIGLAAYEEWQRLRTAVASPEQLFLPAAWAACRELLQAGRPGDAEEVAREALAVARGRDQRGSNTSTQRELSLALDELAGVARAQGDWAQAEAAYRESLDIGRQLVQRLGATPEALRDVSVSLDNVGQVARAQGDWAQAEAAYRESLDIRRQLVQRLGATPEALRDVSVSLNNVGQIARAQGDWAQAEAACRESLDIRRQLVQRLGATPEALRDVSVSLNNVGQIARAQGDWAQAEAAYRESLDIGRQLVQRLGATPEAIDDLAWSLQFIADLPGADPAARAEALHLREELVRRFPHVQRYAEALSALRGENRSAQAPTQP